MKKLLIFSVIIFISVFYLFNIKNVLASEKTIVYLYDDKNRLSDNDIDKLLNLGIKVESIDVSRLDNMKYYYLYRNAYGISRDNETLPVIFSGDKYYQVSIISDYLTDIAENAVNEIKKIDHVDRKMLVYFYSTTCSGCNHLKNETDVFSVLAENEVDIVRVNIANQENLQLFYSYGYEYGYPKVSTPMIFSGDKYYNSAETIEKNLDEIIENASNPLLDVELRNVDTSKYEGFAGTMLILAAGLIDGVNPCAMAMLILFISLLIGVSSSKSKLISVSFAYIFGLFITYFSLGAFLLGFIRYLDPYVSNLSFYINIFIILLSLFLFFFNFHDFIVAKREEYGKIKNQLPKRIQKFNKKVIKFFTDSLNNKNIIFVYLISFSLGVIISLTEFLCTGQVYLPIILMIAHNPQTSEVNGLLYLLLYNIMFVLPLVILASIAIKTQSVMETSNKIREKMHLIKLITGLLFLCIALYYIFKVFGVI